MVKKLLGLLAFSSLNVTMASAATITVCPSGCGYSTIQAAMNAANSGDIILLNVTGTYTEKGITIPEKDLTLRGLGKATTILQSAATRASASGGRIFTRPAVVGAAGTSFVVEDMTIQNAYAPLTDLGNGQSQSIGGVLYGSGVQKGSITKFNRVKFYANETTPGNANNSGGACVYFTTQPTAGFPFATILEATDCDFDDNKVGNSAGTSLSDGPCFDLLGGPNSISIDRCTFTNNSGYTRGGVMYVGSSWTVNIKNSTFANNTARNGDGGCFSARSGTWNVENCLFKNNTAVFVSSVNGNTGSGGVIIGNANFKNCTFFNNSAVNGGAIQRSSNGTEMQLVNCTFYGNSASTQGKTIQFGTTATGATVILTMVNTIITNGGGAAPSEMYFMLPYSQFTNLKNYCNSVTTSNPTPGTTPVFDYNSTNTPTLGLSTTLASNGGPTETLALGSTSGLLNKGTIAPGTYTVPIKDQRDYARTDAGVDIGAYEYNGVVDNTTAPTITYTALTNTPSTTNRTFTATIADANGIHWFGALQPRLYFKKGAAGTWQSTQGVLTTGTGQNGTWTFTVDNSLLGGVALADQIYYYVLAQDVSTTPSIASSPSGVTATSVTTVTIAPSTPDSYTIGTACATVAPSISSQTNIACNGGSTGSATVAATGGTSFTYSWSPTGGTAATATGLTAGAYTVTIKNECLNSATQNVTITQPAALAATTSQTNIACNGGSTGSAGVIVTGGTPTYTYSWSPSGGTGATATGLTAGTYTVTIEDGNLCSTTKSFTISQPAPLAATAAQTNIACNGGSTGSAGVTVTGGTPTYSYSWAPSGGTAATATGLVAGSYTVTIKDGNLCSLTKNFTISQPAALTATTSQTNIACNGGSTGSAGVTVTGGTPTYTYSWSPSGGTGATATGLTAGTYTVTIEDGNLCSTTKSFTISQPAPLAATAAQTNIACNGGSTGSAGVTVTGGTPTYSYSWAPSGGTAATATGLVAGSYTVTIKDGNLCSLTKNFTISQPAALTATTSQTNIACNGGSTGSAGVTVTGGTPTYTYSWAPSGGTGAAATGLTAGAYTVTIEDGNLCSTTKSFTITQSAAVNIGVSLNGNTITANATGANYQWINCANKAAIQGAVSKSFTPSGGGNYAVVVTENTCSDTSVCTDIMITSLDENSEFHRISLYPNPTKGYFKVNLEDASLYKSMKIVNQAGQEVYSKTLQNLAQLEVDLNVPAGLYNVLIFSEEKAKSYKLVIQ